MVSSQGNQASPIPESLNHSFSCIVDTLASIACGILSCSHCSQAQRISPKHYYSGRKLQFFASHYTTSCQRDIETRRPVYNACLPPGSIEVIPKSKSTEQSTVLKPNTTLGHTRPTFRMTLDLILFGPIWWWGCLAGGSTGLCEAR